MRAAQFEMRHRDRRAYTNYCLGLTMGSFKGTDMLRLILRVLILIEYRNGIA